MCRVDNCLIFGSIPPRYSKIRWRTILLMIKITAARSHLTRRASILVLILLLFLSARQCDCAYVLATIMFLLVFVKCRLLPRILHRQGTCIKTSYTTSFIHLVPSLGGSKQFKVAPDLLKSAVASSLVCSTPEQAVRVNLRPDEPPGSHVDFRYLPRLF